MIPFEEMVYMEEENGEGEDIVQVQRVECGVSLIHSRKLAVKSACGNDGTYRADHRKTGDTLMVDGEEGIYPEKMSGGAAAAVYREERHLQDQRGD